MITSKLSYHTLLSHSDKWNPSLGWRWCFLVDREQGSSLGHLKWHKENYSSKLMLPCAPKELNVNLTTRCTKFKKRAFFRVFNATYSSRKLRTNQCFWTLELEIDGPQLAKAKVQVKELKLYSWEILSQLWAGTGHAYTFCPESVGNNIQLLQVFWPQLHQNDN